MDGWGHVLDFVHHAIPLGGPLSRREYSESPQLTSFQIFLLVFLIFKATKTITALTEKKAENKIFF
jgi:hypothetical protein